jgi:hypothetical protein
MRAALMMAFPVGAVLGAVSLVAAGQPVSATANRYSGIVTAVDPAGAHLTVSELGRLGTMRTHRLHVALDTRVTRSERADRDVSDPTHPFVDTPVALTEVRSGEFVVVEVIGSGRTEEARSVTVTAEPSSGTGGANPAAGS